MVRMCVYFLAVTCHMRPGMELSTCDITINAQKVLDFETLEISNFWIRDGELVFTFTILTMLLAQRRM